MSLLVTSFSLHCPTSAHFTIFALYQFLQDYQQPASSHNIPTHIVTAKAHFPAHNCNFCILDCLLYLGSFNVFLLEPKKSPPPPFCWPRQMCRLLITSVLFLALTECSEALQSDGSTMSFWHFLCVIQAKKKKKKKHTHFQQMQLCLMMGINF